MIKIYKVVVIGFYETIFTKTFSREEKAREVYQERLNKELESDGSDDDYPYIKNDIELYELIENEDGEFVFSRTLEQFKGDYS